MSKPIEGQDAVWREYWSKTPDSPYLAAEASVVAGNLVRRFALDDRDVVLDFGCGYGYVSEHLARTVARVFIWDEVEDAMASALARIGDSGVSAIDPSDTKQRFDLIVVNSVVQYMGEETLSFWLRRWSELIAPGGAIAVTDVPDSAPSLLFEGIQWFWLTLRKGVLADAIRFARANSTRYHAARAETGLGTVSEEQLRDLAGAHLVVKREQRNLAYQSGRASYTLQGPQ